MKTHEKDLRSSCSGHGTTRVHFTTDMSTCHIALSPVKCSPKGKDRLCILWPGTVLSYPVLSVCIKSRSFSTSIV
jgi:hypothetical protein